MLHNEVVNVTLVPVDKVCGLAHWGSSATDCVFEYLSVLNIFHNVMALHNKLHKFQKHMTLCPGLFLKRNWRKMNVCLLKGTHLTKKISSRVERRVELNSALETAQESNLHQIQNGAELLANKWVCWLWRGDKMTCSLLSVLRGEKTRTFSQTQGFFILIRHSHYAASMKVVT